MAVQFMVFFVVSAKGGRVTIPAGIMEATFRFPRDGIGFPHQIFPVRMRTEREEGRIQLHAKETWLQGK